MPSKNATAIGTRRISASSIIIKGMMKNGGVPTHGSHFDFFEFLGKFYQHRGSERFVQKV